MATELEFPSRIRNQHVETRRRLRKHPWLHARLRPHTCFGHYPHFQISELNPKKFSQNSTKVGSGNCILHPDSNHSTADCKKLKALKNSEYCNHCGKTGHVARDCFTRQRELQQNTTQLQQSSSNKTDHFSDSTSIEFQQFVTTVKRKSERNPHRSGFCQYCDTAVGTSTKLTGPLTCD
jgi:hypothetical protein